MEEKEIRVLKSDVEVPPVVLEKADAAFARIKEERVNEMKNKKEKSQEQSRIIKYMKPAIVAAACALIFAGVGSRAGVGQPSAPGARGMRRSRLRHRDHRGRSRLRQRKRSRQRKMRQRKQNRRRATGLR